MNRASPSLPHTLLSGQATVIEPFPVGKVDRAIGISGPDDLRDSLQGLEIQFTLQPAFVSANSEFVLEFVLSETADSSSDSRCQYRFRTI